MTSPSNEVQSVEEIARDISCRFPNTGTLKQAIIEALEAERARAEEAEEKLKRYETSLEILRTTQVQVLEEEVASLKAVNEKLLKSMGVWDVAKELREENARLKTVEQDWLKHYYGF